MMKKAAHTLILLCVCCLSCVLYLYYVAQSKDAFHSDPTMNELRELIVEEIQKSEHRGRMYLSPAHSHSMHVHPGGKHAKPNNRKQTAVTNRSSSVKEDTLHKGKGEHSTKMLRDAAKKKYLVYVCDSQYACSGWGDRQRGVVAAYLMSVVTGREFVVNMTSPCSLRTFLEPNEHDWDVPASELAGKSTITIGGVRDTNYHKVFRYKNVNKVFPHDVMYLRSSSDLINAIKMNPHYKDSIPKWAKNQRYSSFRNGWNILMKPTRRLQNRMKGILRTVNLRKEGDLVCAHVRIGKNPSMPNDSPDRNSIESVKELWTFLDPFVKNATRVFIATDSVKVREMARTRFGKKSLDSGGAILHIDRQRKNSAACAGFETVILEQLILARCGVLVVSASNFSIRAGFLRGRKEHLYIFQNSTVKKFNMGN